MAYDEAYDITKQKVPYRDIANVKFNQELGSFWEQRVIQVIIANFCLFQIMELFGSFLGTFQGLLVLMGACGVGGPRKGAEGVKICCYA